MKTSAIQASNDAISPFKEQHPVWLQFPIPTPGVCAYTCAFQTSNNRSIPLLVSADERYELFLDGARLSFGPERGDQYLWFHDRIVVDVPAGPHTLCARVWALGALAPVAQMSVRPGFSLMAEGQPATLLNTGEALWKTKCLNGCEFEMGNVGRPDFPWFTGPNFILDGGQLDDWEAALKGEGGGWQEAQIQVSDLYDRNEFPRRDVMGSLPPRLSRICSTGTIRHLDSQPAASAYHSVHDLTAEARSWQEMLSGSSEVQLGPGQFRRVLLDLGDYYCAFPQMCVSGGAEARIRVRWVESLICQEAALSCGNRSEIEGRQVTGCTCDTFCLDGGRQRQFEPLWWRAGRFIEFQVENQAQALVIHSFGLRETRYPLEAAGRLESGHQPFQEVLRISQRTLQMCSHETYMDCPHWEQLMYVGDTRLQALITYVLHRDDRLVQKALKLFDVSRGPDGLTQSRYPSRCHQRIPPFSLWWISMIYDYAMWRGNPDFVRQLMPGVRAVLDHWLAHVDEGTGLVRAPRGWNFVDWCQAPGWHTGVPVADSGDNSRGEGCRLACFQWQLAMALGHSASLEGWLDEPELAARHRRRAQAIAEAADRTYWDEDRGLYAEDESKERFTEHTQSIAACSGFMPRARIERIKRQGWPQEGVDRATYYFSHYVMEAMHQLGMEALIWKRLEDWFALPEKGLMTTPECPDPSRSDCHAWSAHPLYHAYATVAGIRPAEFGFTRVEIAPRPGDLESLVAVFPHPSGNVELHLRFSNGQLHGNACLPKGLTGELHWKGQTLPLKEGPQEVSLPLPSGHRVTYTACGSSSRESVSSSKEP